VWQDSGAPDHGGQGPDDGCGPDDEVGPDDEAPFRRVAAALRERIATDLAPGARIPSVRALVAEYGVASATASRAVALLRDEGLVETLPRVGTLVAAPGGRRRRVPRTGGESPTREAVVELAVELADADGLAAVSMRRLASELGRPTMSVHGLVRGKDDLVSAMLDHVFTTEVPPEVPARAGWRERLRAGALRQWSVYGRHPWAARAISLHRPQPLPALFALAEWDLSALELVEPDPERRFDLHIVLVGYVRGMAVTLAAEREAEADTGLDADAWTDRDPGVNRALARHAGPALRRAGPYAYDLDRVFTIGLDRLLDGIGSAGLT
jgi:DNA-binding transcriptional regulator YhcF (GntR family)